MSLKKGPPPKPKATGDSTTPASPANNEAKKSDKKKKAKDESDEDDDTTTEKGPEKEDPSGIAEANQLKAEIDPILKSGAVVKALTTAVEAKGKSRELQKMQDSLALTAMESIKADEIAKFVDGASDETLDTLIRITYAGMATGKNCPNLLIWHSKITDKAGIGVIMRAMCRTGY